MSSFEPVTESERERIVTLLRSGRSQTSVAKELARGSATINRIAKAEGLEYTAPKNAVEAKRTFDQTRRLEVIDELVAKARSLVPSVDDPQKLTQLITGVAILIDKRRLEDGEATSRTETRTDGDTRERLIGRLDELANKRAAKESAG